MKESKGPSDLNGANLSYYLGIFRTPTAALLGGVAFAIGHHFFYQSLDGQAPSHDTSDRLYGLMQNLSGQQTNIAVGTLLAFLVKALLGIAISRAQDQFSWKAIKGRPTELRLIDSLLSAQHSIVDVLNIRLWGRHPVAMIIAVVYWLLPFAAVITPATLSISPMLMTNLTLFAAPTIGFGYCNFANSIAVDKHDDTGGSLDYDGPLAPVTRAVSQSLLASAVLPLAAPFPNSTYHVDFQGPALKCSEIEHGSTLWMNQSMTIQNASTNPLRCYKYLAWPSDDTFPWSHSDGYWGFDPPTGLSGSITVVAVGDECSSAAAPNITLVQCQMWNATYSADYSYDEGVQDVVSTITSYESPFEPQPVAITSIVYPELNQPANYMLLWSYMAVMEAFQDYIVGYIWQDPSELDLSFQIDGKVLVTALATAVELNYLKSDIGGLTSSNTANITMAEGIEEMFRNATLSLMSQELLLMPDAPKTTTVTARTYQNIYTYSASILWLAYGIAVGLAALSGLAGYTVAVRAGGSYSTRFSTILRVAYNVRISGGVDLSETSGKDPLPERLENSHVFIPPEGVSVLSMISDLGGVQTDAQRWRADGQGSCPYDEDHHE
ncbi:hypothetical protein PFICI_09890 [Pestalotiopsis fici W106-1]|uniref:Uncharacterized protein n=1 Tax=Pestalotiopsis fici (strain W106-1 / CGMCC3.15140) TaxID=1229662 RepID=W3WVD1_PESFW|nr:uncharacterized protein PFICI_09890 [Pestalotiopsis fici W106-1]ETS77828.1 hypothetical protein PFICI_09890 [Pestalotiopsis fici W106-1]